MADSDSDDGFKFSVTQEHDVTPEPPVTSKTANRPFKQEDSDDEGSGHQPANGEKEIVNDEVDVLQAGKKPTAQTLANRAAENQNLTKQVKEMKEAASKQKGLLRETENVVDALATESEKWTKHARKCKADEKAHDNARRLIKNCSKMP